jgi:V/A-type H+-transporting ATPase subunit E
MDSKSVEYTLDKVASEALTEILAEIEAGKSEALEQFRSMNRSTKAEVAKILEGSEREAESIRRQILGSAELEARNSILRSLEEASNRIVQDSLSAVTVKKPDDYERALAKLISEAALVIGKDAIVNCNTKDKKVVGSIVKELNAKNGMRLTVSNNSVGSMGGVVLESKDGTIRYDNTLEARLERIRPQLRREIVNILSGKSKIPEK